MAQSSGPISQGTTAERQLTDVMWRDRFGDEAGVIGDYNGSAYALGLSSGSDIAQVGSSTQVSTATVAGFAHRIPLASPEPITIPAASGAARTDIICLRYDPAYTGLPGPVRLFRINGTSSGLPTYDEAPPGIEDLPLWAITRQPGQALSAATVLRLFARIAPVITIPVGAPLPNSSPIGSLLRQGSSSYRRELDNIGVPVWTNDNPSQFVKVTGSGLQSIPNAETGSTTVKFTQSERADTSLFTLNTSTGVLTCVRPGWFEVGGQLVLQTSSTLDRGSQRYVQVFRNGTEMNVARGSLVPSTGKLNSQILTAAPGPALLTVGSTLSLGVLQDSGVAQNLRLADSSLWARYLGV